MNGRPPLWYRGWTMVGIGIVMTMLTVGTVTYGFGIYITPVSKELHLSREAANSGIICQHIGTALLTPFIGRLLDRYRVSSIVLASSVLLGGALIMLAFGNALLPKAALLALPVSFGFTGAGAVASYVLVARWFKVRRGRAMAIVAIGQSLSTVTIAPLLAWLIGHFGWRTTLMWQGIAVGAVLFVLSRMIADHPSADEHEPGARPTWPEGDRLLAEDREPPLPILQLLRAPALWITAGVVALTLAVVQALLSSLVPLATARGLSLIQATTLLSALGVSALLGKVVLAVIADRLSRETLVVAAVGLILVFTGVLYGNLGYGWLIGGCLVCGMGVGGFFPVYSSFLADRFGAASLGSSEGLVSPTTSIASALAIHFAGVSFDATGDYRQTLLVFAGALVVALMLAMSLFFVGRPVPARVAVKQESTAR